MSSEVREQLCKRVRVVAIYAIMHGKHVLPLATLVSSILPPTLCAVLVFIIVPYVEGWKTDDLGRDSVAADFVHHRYCYKFTSVLTLCTARSML